MTTTATVLNLEAGTYYLCTCGQSKNSAYCDGSHKGTAFVPYKLELETPQTVNVTEVVKAAQAS